MRKWPNGMASASQAGGCGFEPRLSLHKNIVSQNLGSHPLCGRGGLRRMRARPLDLPSAGQNEPRLSLHKHPLPSKRIII